MASIINHCLDELTAHSDRLTRHIRGVVVAIHQHKDCLQALTAKLNKNVRGLNLLFSFLNNLFISLQPLLPPCLHSSSHQ